MKAYRDAPTPKIGAVIKHCCKSPKAHASDFMWKDDSLKRWVCSNCLVEENAARIAELESQLEAKAHPVPEEVKSALHEILLSAHTSLESKIASEWLDAQGGRDDE